MDSAPIYLDHNATTPLDPEVLEAMRPYFLAPGNAESRHFFGRSARRAWERAKETVGADPGGRPARGDLHLGGNRVEQSGCLRPGRRPDIAGAHRYHADRTPGDRRAGGQTRSGWLCRFSRARLTAEGLADVSSMAGAFRVDTRFATLMLANNETGAIQPVGELAALAAARGIPVHTDAVQAVGRIPVRFPRPWCDKPGRQRAQVPRSGGDRLAAGAQRGRLGSQLFGGGQQQGRRPGTIAVPLAVGLAAALQKWQDRVRSVRRPLDGAARPSGIGPDRRFRTGTRHPQRPGRDEPAAFPRH